MPRRNWSGAIRLNTLKSRFATNSEVVAVWVLEVVSDQYRNRDKCSCRNNVSIVAEHPFYLAIARHRYSRITSLFGHAVVISPSSLSFGKFK